MRKSALFNFQFSIFNFQSIFNNLILKIYNSIKISNFKFQIILIFLLLSTFYLLPSVVHANTTPQANNYPVANTNSDVPNNLHNWTQNVMIEVMSALTCQLAGVDPINPKQGCLGIDSASGKIGFLPQSPAPNGAGGGAIGFMGNMIATLYTPPLHTADYFQNLAQNFGINKKAYAQNTGLPAEASAKAGTGFQGLTPLIGIWSAFRNIVYLFLVIVFVVIGLAIMLRVKIDPRTVMSIQNQIPKIIIGILVVTFSFAIAGFLIDMMWVFIYLIYGIFSGISGVNLDNLNPANIQGENALRVAGHISTGGVFGITHTAANSVKDTLQNILDIKADWAKNIFNPLALGFDVLDPTRRGSVANWFIDIVSYLAGFTVFFKVAHVPNPQSTIPVIGDLFNITTSGVKLGVGAGLGLGAFAGTELLLRTMLPYLIAYLIIFIALLTALFRLWFTLIMAYVHILLDVVLAPFWIIGGIVPGSPISLSGWLRDLIANLAAFPTVIGMFMLGKVFIDAFGTTQIKGEFVPPLIGNPSGTNAIGSLIGLGIILMTPNVVNMLKTALKAPKVDTGLGKTIGAGVGLPVSTIKGAVGLRQGSEEFIIKGFDEKSGKIDYGRRGIVRGFLGRFGR